MIKRQYVFSCYVAHNDGTGDKEYWNTAITTRSFFRFSAEDILETCRSMAVEKLRDRVERTISDQDIQIVLLNSI